MRSKSNSYKTKDLSADQEQTEKQAKPLEFVNGQVITEQLFDLLRIYCESGKMTEELMRKHPTLYSSINGEITSIESALYTPKAIEKDKSKSNY